MKTLQIFDSKNTTYTDSFEGTKRQAIETAIKKSFDFYKVILQIGNKWNEYENGELVSWSYPNGIK